MCLFVATSSPARKVYIVGHNNHCWEKRSWLQQWWTPLYNTTQHESTNWVHRTEKSWFIVILKCCLPQYKKQWFSPLSPPRNSWDFFLVIRGTCWDIILMRNLLEEIVHFLIQDLTLLFGFILPAKFGKQKDNICTGQESLYCGPQQSLLGKAILVAAMVDTFV